MNIDRVCWNITSRCNDNCSFCFRDKESKSISIENALKIIDNLCNSGIKHIAFSGGEALLYNKIFDLLDYAHGKKLEITLISNGILLDNVTIDKLEKSVNWVAVPIDNLKNVMMCGRNDKHMDNIDRCLKYIETNNINISVKINTVLTSKNYNYLEEIYTYISRFNCIKRWNIFEFIDIRGNAVDNSKVFRLTSEQYAYAKKCLKKINIDKRLRVTLKSRETLLSSYIVINPMGLLMLYNEDSKQEVVLGDLNQEELKIMMNRNIDRYDLERYKKRIQNEKVIFV